MTTKDTLRTALCEEFKLNEEQAHEIARKLDGLVEYYERYVYSDIGGPGSRQNNYTTFDKISGLPIVHSTKVGNYRVHVAKLYKSQSLHETLFDILEDSITVYRLLYRIARFGVAGRHIELDAIESAIYYLLWVDDITPIETREGYNKISDRLIKEFGGKIDHARYQACLDELCKAGLIEIVADKIELIEKPRL